jgi:hypothetical protein
VTALRDQLDAWTRAGLITEQQASAIAAHEAAAPTAVSSEALPPPPGRAAPPAVRRAASTTGAEAIGYVGAALALGAIVLLVDNLWSQLVTGGRLAVLVLLTGMLFGAGLLLQRSTAPAMQRLSSVLFTGTVAGAGWVAATVARDLLGLLPDQVGAVAGAVATAAAIPLYALRTRALVQLALLAAVLTMVISLLGVPAMRPGALWHGVLVATVGAAWVLLARGGWHRPRLLAEILGAALVLIGAQIASFEPQRIAPLVAGVAIAGLLVALAVWLDELHLLVVGTLGLFVLVPQLVFEVFGDVIGAPATLLVIGLVLVLLAVGLGRARRGLRGRWADPDDRTGPEPAEPAASSAGGGGL